MIKKPFEALVGNERAKTILSANVDHCVSKIQPFPHTIMTGGPGLGKTSFARAVAQCLHHSTFIEIDGLIKSKDLVTRLLMACSSERPVIVFWDEIHAIDFNSAVIMLPVMQSRKMIVGSGSASVTITMPMLTVIGATTNPEKLPEPLRERFVLKVEFEEYRDKEIAIILKRYLQCSVTKVALEMLVDRSAGTPRRAIGLASNVNALRNIGRRNSLHGDIGRLDVKELNSIFDLLRIYPGGLLTNEIKYLNALSEDKPKSLRQVAASLHLGDEAVALTIEPLLFRKKLVEVTARGRVITKAGVKYLTNIKSHEL